MGFAWESCVFRSAPPDTKDVLFRAGELSIQVKMITGDHVGIARETCRVVGMGTQILTTKDIPENEADTLSDRFGELVEGCDGFAGVHPEHKFQIVRWRQRCACAQKGERRHRCGGCDQCIARRSCKRSHKPGELSWKPLTSRGRYRIACTLQLLVFFFFCRQCALTQRPSWVVKAFWTKARCRTMTTKFQGISLPVMAMVLITILYDGTIISIAYDYVAAGKVPEKWNLPVVCSIAALLGRVACGRSTLCVSPRLNLTRSSRNT